MIISRTPLRISFAGGGSDLPSFYKRYGGAVLSTTIDKYVYIAVHDYFYPNQTLLKYSKTELVNTTDEIQHPLFRECLNTLNLSGLDISSMADVPAGTGLGSSSSFTVSLLNVLHAYKHEAVSAEYLASMACDIEINRLGDPIGKQDQYAAAYGGLNFIRFAQDGSVKMPIFWIFLHFNGLIEQKIVQNSHGSHGFNDGYCSGQHTGVMSSFGFERGGVSLYVYRLLFHE